MPKFIDLDEFDQEKVGDFLEAKAIVLGMDKWESRSARYNALKEVIGICYDCQGLRCYKTEFGNVLALCATFRTRLYGEDRVVECNEHSPRGQMTLRDMENIATLIDSDKSEIKGFISRDPKLRKKT